MPNLLSIESNFLRLPEVATALRLVEVRTIQRTITNAKKKKFEQSLALAQHVKSAFEWYKSTEGQNRFREEGITWTAEDFGQKVFGWQKSFFYKMVKVASVPAEVVESYSATADQSGEESQRSVEELLKHANSVESGENEVEREAPQPIILSVNYTKPDGTKVAFKINALHQLKTKSTQVEICEAIAYINSQF